jgi:hypothetical protein
MALKVLLCSGFTKKRKGRGTCAKQLQYLSNVDTLLYLSTSYPVGHTQANTKHKHCHDVWTSNFLANNTQEHGA